MTGAILGSAGISAGSNLLGGVLNNVIGSKQSEKDWQRNFNAQKEFAQNSIQWRVQDAQKAGIHPLYAMGQSPGYTPSSSFSTGSMGDAIAQAGNAFGQAMGQLGMMNAYLQNSKLQADVETARLTNDSKKLELFQKMVSNSMGQKSQTMPHVTGQGEADLWLGAGGAGRVLPNQLESEIASAPADIAKLMETQYNSAAVEKLPVPKNVDRYYHLSPLGYSYTDLPKGANKGDLGFWGNVTNAWYKGSKSLGKGVDWLLKKFYSW